MRIEKTVSLPGIHAPFTIAYTQQIFTQGDSEVKIYDDYKISLLLSDGLAAVLNDKIIDTGKNSILFFRPDEIHFGRFFRSGMHSYIDFFLPVSLYKSLFDNEELTFFLTDSSADRVNYILPDTNRREHLSELAQEAISALTGEAPVNDVELFSVMIQVLLLCSRSYEAQKSNPLPSEIPKFVNHTLSYIAENYDKALSLHQLASQAGCSVAYLSRIFKQYTGKTIYNHIIDIRIGNAQILLRNGKSVTEACSLSGFEDCSNFIKTFKKLTGQTPLQFKNNICGIR